MLTSRRWLGAFGVALAFAVAAYFLGQWQWHRYEAKAARADRIHATTTPSRGRWPTCWARPPMPLSEEWTRVTMQGRYAADETLLVRNRPFDGTYGYEVLVPFSTTSGATVLVDRGWVLNAKTAETLPDVVPAPHRDGHGHRVAAALASRPWARACPPGQLASINLDEASRQVGSPLLGAYVVPRGRAAARRHGTRPADRAGAAGHRPRTAPGLRVPVVARHGGRVRAGLVRRPSRVPRGLSGTPRSEPASQAQEGPDLGRGRRLSGHLPSGGHVGAAALLVGELGGVEVVVEAAARRAARGGCRARRCGPRRRRGSGRRHGPWTAGGR